MAYSLQIGIPEGCYEYCDYDAGTTGRCSSACSSCGTWGQCALHEGHACIGDGLHLCEGCARGHFPSETQRASLNRPDQCWSPPYAWTYMSVQQRLDYYLTLGLPWRLAYAITFGWPSGTDIPYIHTAPTSYDPPLPVSDHSAHPTAAGRRARPPADWHSAASSGQSGATHLVQHKAKRLKISSSGEVDNSCSSSEGFLTPLDGRPTCREICTRCNNGRCYDEQGHGDDLHICASCAAEYCIRTPVARLADRKPPATIVPHGEAIRANCSRATYSTSAAPTIKDDRASSPGTFEQDSNSSTSQPTDLGASEGRFSEVTIDEQEAEEKAGSASEGELSTTTSTTCGSYQHWDTNSTTSTTTTSTCTQVPLINNSAMQGANAGIFFIPPSEASRLASAARANPFGPCDPPEPDHSWRREAPQEAAHYGPVRTTLRATSTKGAYARWTSRSVPRGACRQVNCADCCDRIAFPVRCETCYATSSLHQRKQGRAKQTTTAAPELLAV